MPAVQLCSRFQSLPQLHGPVRLVHSNFTGVIQNPHALQLLQQKVGAILRSILGCRETSQYAVVHSQMLDRVLQQLGGGFCCGPSACYQLMLKWVAVCNTRACNTGAALGCIA